LRLLTLYLCTFVFCLLFFLYVWPAFCHAIIKRILMIDDDVNDNRLSVVRWR